MCDLRNFQQEVSRFTHDLTSTFPPLVSSVEKIQSLLEEMIHAFNEYLRSVNKVGTPNKNIFSDEKTSVEQEFHYDNDDNDIKKSEPSLEELIVQKIEILRARLKMLQTTKQKLTEESSNE
ncbi:hypothetical protein INT45_004410 [Circinella minor]|uniref:Uncharacterized protein n=1 Tax=Circinella minor TaxID=1195481 RepID=A0A8H7S9I6_9FUNG|nr:hypothetical protein INT45_004410 [Circinella minor]